MFVKQLHMWFWTGTVAHLEIECQKRAQCRLYAAFLAHTVVCLFEQQQSISHPPVCQPSAPGDDVGLHDTKYSCNQFIQLQCDSNSQIILSKITVSQSHQNYIIQTHRYHFDSLPPAHRCATVPREWHLLAAATVSVYADRTRVWHDHVELRQHPYQEFYQPLVERSWIWVLWILKIRLTDLNNVNHNTTHLKSFTSESTAAAKSLELIRS